MIELTEADYGSGEALGKISFSSKDVIMVKERTVKNKVVTEIAIIKNGFSFNVNVIESYDRVLRVVEKSNNMFSE